jgi:hypothetical protein
MGAAEVRSESERLCDLAQDQADMVAFVKLLE